MVMRIIEKIERRANTIERMLRTLATSEDLGSSNILQIKGFQVIHQVILPAIVIKAFGRSDSR